MSNATENANTISSTVVLTDTKTGKECVDDKIVNELITRLQGAISFTDPNTAIVSQSAPSDLTKIWFQQDGTGAVQSINYYDSNTGQWTEVTSTSAETNAITLCSGDNLLTKEDSGCYKVDPTSVPVRSTGSANLIELDANGHWIVNESVVRDIAVTLDVENLCNVLQKSASSNTLSVDRGAHGFAFVGDASNPIIAGYEVFSDEDHATPQSVDLTAMLTVTQSGETIDWTNCPPNAVTVVGAVAVRRSTTGGPGDTDPTWVTPDVEVRAGNDFLQRIAFQMKSDTTSSEGSDLCERTIPLTDPTDFRYQGITDRTVDWSDEGNAIRLYITQIHWTTPVTA